MTAEASTQRAEAQWTSLQLSEVPPSANNLFAHGMHGRFKTPAYKAWLTLTKHEINRQKPPRVAGAYALTLRFGRTRKLMAGTGQLSFRTEHLAEGVTLYQGDCREVLPTLGKVDAVVTDPPYGIGLEYGVFEDSEENVKDLVGMFVPWSIENASRTLITSGNQCQHLYPRPKWTLAWVTPAGAGSGPWGFSCWQPILAYGSCPYLTAGKGRRSDIFVHTEASEKNGHPCPKPLNFMNKLVERASLVNQIVLDPFMGSGTTGVAAVKLGRKFIGIEIEPKYFDIACRRISEALKQPDMFIERPAPAKQEAFNV